MFPKTDGVKGFHDITPRMGVAYDVFGNGKTSLKANFSKYLQPANNESVFTSGNPAVSFAADDRAEAGSMPTATTWPIATCDNSAANGECEQWDNLNFGKATSAARR